MRPSRHALAKNDDALDIQWNASTGKLCIIAERAWLARTFMRTEQIIMLKTNNVLFYFHCGGTRQRQVALDPISFSLRRACGIANSFIHYSSIYRSTITASESFRETEWQLNKKNMSSSAMR